MATEKVEDLIYPEASLASVEFPPPGEQQVGNCYRSLKESDAPK